MADVSLHRQFAGQARLVRLLLWRVGDSTDIDKCLSTAKLSNMINDADETFIRQCLELEESLRDTLTSKDASTLDCTSEVALIDEPTILRLRRCVDKLNQADSA